MSDHILPTPRVRVTAATERRCKAMRDLIARLHLGEMLRDEFSEFLHFSASGARKYIQELRDAGVISAVRLIDATPWSAGIPVYALTEDFAAIDAFLASLDSQRTAPMAGLPKLARGTDTPSDPARHVHIMADDTRYKVQLSGRKIPAPCPVLAAFFGLVGAAA